MSPTFSPEFRKTFWQRPATFKEADALVREMETKAAQPAPADYPRDRKGFYMSLAAVARDHRAQFIGRR